MWAGSHLPRFLFVFWQAAFAEMTAMAHQPNLRRSPALELVGKFAT
jgi:hypothetical protein